MLLFLSELLSWQRKRHAWHRSPSPAAGWGRRHCGRLAWGPRQGLLLLPPSWPAAGQLCGAVLGTWSRLLGARERRGAGVRCL